jgi:ABC-2 type transport system ATP-binding protein
MADVLVLDKLTKHYGHSKVAAVDNLSLSISGGEVYGFLGSNGAGKSTTIRLILDFIRPTDGTINVFGQDNTHASATIRRDISYLAGDVALPKKVTGRQLLHYLGRLQGGFDESYLSDLEHRFQAQLDKKIDTLSKGNRQKIGLIQAFMHQPKLLVLDEPTSGLDPLMQEQFYIAVEEAKQRGAAVFLSSHSFSEVERICDRVGIIRQGKLVHQGTIASMRAAQLPVWNIVVARASDITTLKKSSALKVKSSQGTTVTVQPTHDISSALAALSKVKVLSLNPSQDDLETEFMSFYDKGKSL